jgi:hypothetical protein
VNCVLWVSMCVLGVVYVRALREHRVHACVPRWVRVSSGCEYYS